ncbi:MAG: hypothetical protein GY869_25575, partial [Planctomycetes bacterium]|nr:hypothetical protein [Planctomycetota bacterium]
DYRIGGSHGGSGYGSSTPTFDNYLAPQLPGSGGGIPSRGNRGGGAIRLITAQLQIEGLIQANGATSNSTNNGDNAAGAGGSIWITADEISGSGQIYAKGGSNNYDGGGGRIAIYSPVMTGSFTGNLSVWGYGSGTIYLSDGGPGESAIIFDNDGNNNPTYIDSGDVQYSGKSIIIRDNARVVFRDTISLENLDLQSGRVDFYGNAYINKLQIKSGIVYSTGASDDTLFADTIEILDGGILGHYSSGRNDPRMLKVISDVIRIYSGGKIDVTDRGYPYGYTVNGDTAATDYRIGGSHGGSGYGSSTPVFDNYLTPQLPGSGGGIPSRGNRGGGAMRLISVQLQIDGSIQANGGTSNSANNGNNAAGAGGSIWITADEISGSGQIYAKGGNNNYDGGGGRIAIYSPVMTGEFLNNLSTWGYGPGSIYLDYGANNNELRFVDNTSIAHSASINNSTHRVIFKNNGQAHFHSNSVLGNVSVQNTGLLIISDTLFADSLTIESGGNITHYSASRFTPRSL